MKIFDWTAKYSDDRGIIRAAMMARKKKMARCVFVQCVVEWTGWGWGWVTLA